MSFHFDIRSDTAQALRSLCEAIEHHLEKRDDDSLRRLTETWKNSYVDNFVIQLSQVVEEKDPPGLFLPRGEHCDDWIDDPDKPIQLRRWLLLQRLPATDRLLLSTKELDEMRMYALKDGIPVRLMMASRFGDVGITAQLKNPTGYTSRVRLSQLREFTNDVLQLPV